MRKRKVAKVIPAHNSLISTVKYQPQYGNYLTTASFDGKIRLWSSKNWGLMKTLSGHEDKISCVDISPVTPVQIKMEVEDDDADALKGYFPPSQLVSSSFDRTWKLWAPDVLSTI
jgi:WD40 repeat protein